MTSCRETPVAKFVVCSWHEQGHNTSASVTVTVTVTVTVHLKGAISEACGDLTGIQTQTSSVTIPASTEARELMPSPNDMMIATDNSDDSRK